MKNHVLSAVMSVAALSVTPAAFAGEGGIAGAAAFTLSTDGSVTDVAVASAIGKTSAVAGAAFDGDDFEAFALGTGAEFEFEGVTGLYIYGYEESKSGLETAQANTISALAIGPVQLTPDAPSLF